MPPAIIKNAAATPPTMAAVVPALRSWDGDGAGFEILDEVDVEWSEGVLEEAYAE